MMDELIERLEKADGPSRELDEAIYFAVFGEQLHLEHWTRAQLADLTPWFTASMDAAMTLVPEGSYRIFLERGPGPETYWTAGLRRHASDTLHEGHGGHLDTNGALALCIAALRARGQQT